MASSVSRSAIEAMRAIVGNTPTEMELIRYLHLAKSDVTKAINLFLDSGSSFFSQPLRTPSRPQVKPGPQTSPQTSPTLQEPPVPTKTKQNVGIHGDHTTVLAESSALAESALPATPANSAPPATLADSAVQGGTHSRPEREELGLPKHELRPVELSRRKKKAKPGDCAYLLLGQAQVCAFATSKGRKLQPGDEVTLTFPKETGQGSQPGGKGLPDKKKQWGRQPKGPIGADIVRFSTAKAGEIGRLPGDWAKCLAQLSADMKIRVEASCLSAPEKLLMMDNIYLSLRVFVKCSMFTQKTGGSLESASALSETSTGNPFTTLLRLFNMQPHKKAEFTPEDFYNRKRSFEQSEAPRAQEAPTTAVLLPAAKRSRALQAGSISAAAGPALESAAADENGEPVLNDDEVSRLVGSTDATQLEEREAPESLTCELRPYQKQALWWMANLESGNGLKDADRTLHPCWEAYRLSDPSKSEFYHNVFSGEVSLDFPSAMHTARGGILADAMGLGKTVMTLALMMTNQGRGGDSPSSPAEIEPPPPPPADGVAAPSTDLFAQPKRRPRKGAGTLIVCPLTLLAQWKSECETHVKGGNLSVYVYYGTDRSKEKRLLLEHDVVITTYGVLSSECSNEKAIEDSPLHSLHWFRVVLDEAHTIKACRSQQAKAAFHLTSDRRWCLTGTPIQNQLEDMFSLLHFLRVEPWSNWGWWHKLIQRPYDEGDERSLRLLQGILKPLMLRRTKESTDKEGKPILILPPADMQVVECELTASERDFYDALHQRSKVKFDTFVEQGRVLHNYAHILELLLRLRQCCDHPFLVLSRGDVDTDMDNVARRFLQKPAEDGLAKPTRAYVKNAVESLKAGNNECPICLEAPEDAVLTPCLHSMCRECLLASWRSTGGGACPVCRQPMTRQDLVTAPSESRFQIDVEAQWKESAKVRALFEHLDALQESGEKSIIFSQWTAFLDLLEIAFKRRNKKFVRLDGKLDQAHRERVIGDFSSNPSIKVMLISLKAGGVGINLTAASNAFLLDPWWNPAVEDQAIMRIHRIGQTKPVKVRRFIVKDTVEERMQAVQARKQRLVNGALTDQEVKSARIEELKMLFR